MRTCDERDRDDGAQEARGTGWVCISRMCKLVPERSRCVAALCPMWPQKSSNLPSPDIPHESPASEPLVKSTRTTRRPRIAETAHPTGL
jgi:hypothetical protein